MFYLNILVCFQHKHIHISVPEKLALLLKQNNTAQPHTEEKPSNQHHTTKLHILDNKYTYKMKVNIPTNTLYVMRYESPTLTKSFWQVLAFINANNGKYHGKNFC